MPSLVSDKRPHSVEAEQSALRALLIDPDKLAEVAAELKREDFHDPIHSTVYQAMLQSQKDGQPLDLITLSDALNQNGSVQEIGGSAFLASLANVVPTASLATAYAGIVRERSLRRKLMNLARDTDAIAQDRAAPPERRLRKSKQRSCPLTTIVSQQTASASSLLSLKL